MSWIIGNGSVSAAQSSSQHAGRTPVGPLKLGTLTKSGLCEDWDFLLESGLELTSKKHSASSERTVGKWKLIGPKLRRLVFFSPEKLIEFVRNLIRKQHHGTAWVNALHVRPNYA